MRILVSLFVCVLTLVVLAGCGPRYRIGDETFSSSSEALQKHSEKISRDLSKIAPTNNPVHGTVLVVYPSDGEIQKNYIRFSGSPARVQHEQIDFIITSTNTHFRYMVDAIKKREIFDSVSVARHNGNPASFPIGDCDYMIFVDVDGWFIRGRDNPRGLPITFDKTKSDGTPRPIAFLDLLGEKAKMLHSK